MDEEDVDAVPLEKKVKNVDGKHTIDDLDELQKQDVSDDSYEIRIQKSIDLLRSRSDEFLSTDKLDQYSPKFLEMYNNIVDKDE
jgi:hypothetical protein